MVEQLVDRVVKQLNTDQPLEGFGMVDSFFNT
jgi:hypothetical protein